MVTDRGETLKCLTGEVGPFIMSSEARPGSPLELTVAIALVTIIVVGLGAGYYFAYGQNSLPNNFPVAWSVNPLKIKFDIHSATSASAPDSFTCSSTVSPVTLQAFSSQPDNISVTVSPSSFSSCGSTPDSVTVTAACTAAALANGTCPGDLYTGTVVVCGPTSYTCLKRALAVGVAVTTRP
jgi:hypothetical protein